MGSCCSGDIKSPEIKTTPYDSHTNDLGNSERKVDCHHIVQNNKSQSQVGVIYD